MSKQSEGLGAKQFEKEAARQRAATLTQPATTAGQQADAGIASRGVSGDKASAATDRIGLRLSGTITGRKQREFAAKEGKPPLIIITYRIDCDGFSLTVDEFAPEQIRPINTRFDEAVEVRAFARGKGGAGWGLAVRKADESWETT